jgi:hypothetical protein
MRSLCPDPKFESESRRAVAAAVQLGFSTVLSVGAAPPHPRWTCLFSDIAAPATVGCRGDRAAAAPRATGSNRPTAGAAASQDLHSDRSASRSLVICTNLDRPAVQMPCRFFPSAWQFDIKIILQANSARYGRKRFEHLTPQIRSLVPSCGPTDRPAKLFRQASAMPGRYVLEQIAPTHAETCLWLRARQQGPRHEGAPSLPRT